MKKLFSVAALLFMVVIAAGQNVGIGTNAPSAQFHTTGNVRFESLGGQGVRPVFADASGYLTAYSTQNASGSQNNATSYSVPTFGCAKSNISFAAPAGSKVTSVSVSLSIQCTNVSGINIALKSPDSKTLTLVNFQGGLTGSDFTNTVFSDAGTTTALYGTAPYTGTFKPDGGIGNSDGGCAPTSTITSFAGFNNIDPNGTWALCVSTGSTACTLLNWQLTINSSSVSGGGGGVDNYIPKWNAGTLTTTSNVFDNGTNVGIGTATPASTLEVNGSIKNKYSGSILSGILSVGTQTVNLSIPALPSGWTSSNTVILVSNADGQPGTINQAKLTSLTNIQVSYNALSAGTVRFNYIIFKL